MSQRPFTRLTARAAPLMQPNIDTDVVIRINRLIENRQGELGPWCFEAIRYRPDGTGEPEFEPDQPRYRGAEILVAGDNFGCGSSREAAVWALMDYGVRCIIATSFGDIFAANCFQNGLLPIRLPAAEVEAIAAELAQDDPTLTVDLEAEVVTTPAGRRLDFEIDPERRRALLLGLDEIGMTLQHEVEIDASDAIDRERRPWIYPRRGTGAPLKLLILAGDGVGPEILAQVRRVAVWFADRRGLVFDLEEELFGFDAWRAHGDLMRPETWARIEAADAILFGAIGGPGYDQIPPEARQRDYLLEMRKQFDLFLNLRPIKLLEPLVGASTLKPEVVAGCDMVIVRELTGGLYFSEPRGIETLADGSRRGVNTLSYTEEQIRRIARAAFELARTRQGRVCSVDKANVLEVFALWREVVQALRDSEYPDVALSHMYVDNAAMQLVRNPRQFDVMVTENLFGDILSDCAAMIAGSLGMLPSSSLGPVRADGTRKALYEPIHGSAPDIAGKGVVNPLGAILSFGQCLRYSFGAPQEADLLEQAVAAAIAAGARTADIAEPGQTAVSTAQMGDQVLKALDALA
jgi:3-isopropylmalate dehydrogenase